MAKLTATYEYDADDRSWVVQLKEEPGVITGAVTLAECRELLLDAASVGLERTVTRDEIVEVFPMTKAEATLLDQVRQLDEEIAEIQAKTEALELRRHLRRVVIAKRLKEGPYSTSDIAALLNVSRSRAGQLANEDMPWRKRVLRSSKQQAEGLERLSRRLGNIKVVLRGAPPRFLDEAEYASRIQKALAMALLDEFKPAQASRKRVARTHETLVSEELFELPQLPPDAFRKAAK